MTQPRRKIDTQLRSFWCLSLNVFVRKLEVFLTHRALNLLWLRTFDFLNFRPDLLHLINLSLDVKNTVAVCSENAIIQGVLLTRAQDVSRPRFQLLIVSQQGPICLQNATVL